MILFLFPARLQMDILCLYMRCNDTVTTVIVQFTQPVQVSEQVIAVELNWQILNLRALQAYDVGKKKRKKICKSCNLHRQDNPLTSLKIFIMTSFISVSVLSGDECVFFSSKVPKENPLVSIDCREVTGDWNNSFHNNHPSTVWISFCAVTVFFVLFCFVLFFWLFSILQVLMLTEVKDRLCSSRYSPHRRDWNFQGRGWGWGLFNAKTFKEMYQA